MFACRRPRPLIGLYQSDLMLFSDLKFFQTFVLTYLDWGEKFHENFSQIGQMIPRKLDFSGPPPLVQLDVLKPREKIQGFLRFFKVKILLIINLMLLTRFGQPGTPDYEQNLKVHRKFIVKKLVEHAKHFIEGIHKNFHRFPVHLANIKNH